MTELTVLANMPLKSSKPSSLYTGFDTRTFQDSPLMSTYLVAIAVGQFGSISQTLPSGDKISVYASEDKLPMARYGLRYIVAMRKYFTDFFGTPDLVPKSDHIALSDHSALAMENWGLVTYVASCLLVDEDTASHEDKFRVSLVIAHEIAHTWFGNMVTLEWWSDLWLNEGFASLLMYIAMNDTNPDWNVFEMQMDQSTFAVMYLDSQISTHAISSNVDSLNAIMQTFDRISYDKGMLILSMLRSIVGPVNFRGALRKYVNRYSLANARMADLWRIFDQTVYVDFKVEDLMQSWVMKAGYPVVNVTLTAGGGLKLTQQKFTLNSNDTRTARADPNDIWYVQFTYSTSNSPHATRKVWLTTRESRGLRLYEAGRGMVEDPNWIVGNIDHVGFYRVNYEPSMWRAITLQLRRDYSVFSAPTRAGLIDDAFNLARLPNSGVTYAIALQLSEHVRTDASLAAWSALLINLEYVDDMLANTAAYGVFKEYLLKLVEPLVLSWDLRKISEGTLSQITLKQRLLDLACRVGMPKALDYVRQQFAAWRSYGQPLPVEFQMVIIAQSIKMGGDDEWKFIWEEYIASTDSALRQVLVEGLACTSEPWLVTTLLSTTLFVGEGDENHAIMSDIEKRIVWRKASKSSVARLVTLDFYKHNWPLIVERMTGAFLLREIVSSLIYSNTREQLREIRALHELLPPPEEVSQVVEEAYASIESNIEWMDRNYDYIVQTFTSSKSDN